MALACPASSGRRLLAVHRSGPSTIFDEPVGPVEESDSLQAAVIHVLACGDMAGCRTSAPYSPDARVPKSSVDLR